MNPEIVSMIGISSRFPVIFAGHRKHVFLGAILYALMVFTSVYLEIAYSYDQYFHFAVISGVSAFAWSLCGSMGSLFVAMAMIRRNRGSALATSIAVLSAFAALNVLVLRPFFPAEAVTRATFQTWTAQAAYFKGVVYCTCFAIIFELFPFAFIATMQRELARGRHQTAGDLLFNRSLAVAPRGAPFIPSWVFGLLLIAGAVWSIVSSAHLLEALAPAPYRNLFINLIELRWLLFLAFGAECCWWYYASLNELKRECATLARLGPG